MTKPCLFCGRIDCSCPDSQVNLGTRTQVMAGEPNQPGPWVVTWQYQRLTDRVEVKMISCRLAPSPNAWV